MSVNRLQSYVGHPAVGALCRVLLGGIFIYTGLPKLLRPDEFARLVYGYQILHADMANLVGIIMPWLEVIVGLFLVIGILPQSSALVTGGLLGGFIVFGFLGIVRGLDISCGCFFPFMGDEKLGWDLVIRDAILLFFTAQVLIWPSSFLPGKREG